MKFLQGALEGTDSFQILTLASMLVATLTAGVVSFTDSPVLTWHWPINFSYPGAVGGTLP